MQDLQISHERVDSLMPAARNARTHSNKQIRQIAECIRQYGFLNPVLRDKDGRIIAGHGRVEAAKLLKRDTVPVICADQLTPDQARAFAIAENKLSELGGWDIDTLSLELGELIDLDFDPLSIGFEIAEIDALLVHDDDASGEEKVFEPDRSKPAVTIVGDLWHVGPHRLIWGDARDPAVFADLLGADRAQLVFVDPPFNVAVAGHVSGLGKHRHREFPMASGEMSPADFTAFLSEVLTNQADFSVDGSVHYVCMDFRHMSELLEAGSSAYAKLLNLCVWVKTNGGMGSLYRGQHELVFVFKAGTAPHINNVELGKNGRYRTNVWRYAGANAFGKDRDDHLAMHPTVKPIAMVIDAILDCSARGGLILDSFVGSGTTLLSAHSTGRHGAGIELDPLYVDLALERLGKAVGTEPILAASGQTYAEVRAARLQESRS